MSIFSFKKVECPRCLGKGHVDERDIERLNMQLMWSPGACAYCDGNGKVPERNLKKVPVDEMYLTMDISSAERKRLFHQDEGAMNRAKRNRTDVDFYFKQIQYLHFEGDMDVEKIAKFYRIDADENMPSEQEMRAFIQRIIDLKKS